MPLDLTGGQQPGYPGRGAGEWPDLSDVLLAGENVSFIGRARVTTSHLPRLGRWLVVVTDRRLICVRDARRGARQQLHVALDRIEHAYQRGVLGGKVVVSTRRGKLRVVGLGRIAGGELVGWLLAPSRAERSLSAQLAPAPAAAALPRMLEEDAAAARVEELESVVHRLTQQVGFLEELMRTRQEQALPRAP